jgi:hypothetical protein
MPDLSVFFREYMPLREDYQDRVDLIESIREDERERSLEKEAGR